MPNASHTPGPWKVGTRFPSRIIAEGGNVANTCHPADEHDPNPTELANARLIAAAPEMLDLLTEWVAGVTLIEGDHHALTGHDPEGCFLCETVALLARIGAP